MWAQLIMEQVETFEWKGPISWGNVSLHFVNVWMKGKCVFVCFIVKCSSDHLPLKSFSLQAAPLFIQDGFIFTSLTQSLRRGWATFFHLIFFFPQSMFHHNMEYLSNSGRFISVCRPTFQSAMLNISQAVIVWASIFSSGQWMSAWIQETHLQKWSVVSTVVLLFLSPLQ